MADDPVSQARELDAKIFGQEMRSKGYRLMDLIWFPLAIGMLFCGMLLWQYEKTLATLVIEQRRTTEAMREGLCMLDPEVKKRPDARDFCVSLTRSAQ